MVSGLLVPTLGAYFWQKSDAGAALAAMLAGGGSTLILIFTKIKIIWGLDASIIGIMLSAIIFFSISLIKSKGSSHV
jgi:SSS family solute:Na+ symporter